MKPTTPKNRRMRGFERASGLMQDKIRKAGESRGFAESRLLTHWAEIVGPEFARICRPVNVSYARGGFGGTLTLLTTGAQAPILQMQAEKLRERINACYGYAAIRRIAITQTAPTGFAEGQASFDPAPRRAQTAKPDPETLNAARSAAAPVTDESLRRALETLGANVLLRTRRNQG